MNPKFAAGTTIQRREVLHGAVWLRSPVRVIADDGTDLAVLLEPGSKFTFPEHPFGPHPWQPYDHWTRTQVLQLYRADLPYSVWMFFRNGAFQNWYVNFEAPLLRQGDAIDTLDFGLDLVIDPDGARRWKDVEDLAPMLRSGRMTVTDMMSVLEAAEQVDRSLAVNDRWWSTWDTWRPPPSQRRTRDH